MQLHPDIAALRGDDTPQRQAQAAQTAAMARWREQADVAPVLADVARLAQGADLADCAVLAPLFEAGNEAGARFAQGFVKASALALADQPLGHVAARHFTNGITSTLLLAHEGEVTLALASVVAGAKPPTSISFAPVDYWEHVLAGEAETDLVTCQPEGPNRARLQREPLVLTAGRMIARDGAEKALVFGRIAGCLVSLRLQRRRANAGPVREYAAATGTLVHRAAGSQKESRRALMANLLGRMGRRDAAPTLAEIALEPGPDALRWQALRECLGLDAAIGFGALSAMAARAGDTLARPAGALRAQLLEAHPQLAKVVPCPA